MTIPPVRVVSACFDGMLDCPFFSWEPWPDNSFRVDWKPVWFPVGTYTVRLVGAKVPAVAIE